MTKMQTEFEKTISEFDNNKIDRLDKDDSGEYTDSFIQDLFDYFMFGVKHGGMWINISDKQPNNGQQVIIWYDNGWSRGVYSEATKRFYIGGKTLVQSTFWTEGPASQPVYKK